MFKRNNFLWLRGTFCDLKVILKCITHSSFIKIAKLWQRIHLKIFHLKHFHEYSAVVVTLLTLYCDASLKFFFLQRSQLSIETAVPSPCPHLWKTSLHFPGVDYWNAPHVESYIWPWIVLHVYQRVGLLVRAQFCFMLSGLHTVLPSAWGVLCHHPSCTNFLYLLTSLGRFLFARWKPPQWIWADSFWLGFAFASDWWFQHPVVCSWPICTFSLVLLLFSALPII